MGIRTATDLLDNTCDYEKGKYQIKEDKVQDLVKAINVVPKQEKDTLKDDQNNSASQTMTLEILKTIVNTILRDPNIDKIVRFYKSLR